MPMNFSSWFDPSIIYEKREFIAGLIKAKMLEAAGEEIVQNLPDISFHADSEDVQIIESSEDLNGNADANVNSENTNGNCEDANGNCEDANGNCEDSNGNFEDTNGNGDDDTNGNGENNNGNGENNNEEVFNNNNDFNAVDNNIQQPPQPVIESTAGDVASSEDMVSLTHNNVSSSPSLEIVPTSPPHEQISPAYDQDMSEDLFDSEKEIEEVTVIIDSD